METGGRDGAWLVMRKRRILVSVGVVALVGLWVFWAYEPGNTLSPPTAIFVSAEPSGMNDDSGVELLLVTFSVSNTNRLEEPSDQRSNTVWVKDSVKPAAVRIQNGWRAVTAASARSTTFALIAGQETQGILLVPVGTDCCRVRLQYTGERSVYPLTPKGVLSSMVAKLPLGVRSRISKNFWRWADFPRIGPDTKWKEIWVEFPVHGQLDSQLTGHKLEVK